MGLNVHETTSHSMYARRAVLLPDPQSPKGATDVKKKSERRTLSHSLTCSLALFSLTEEHRKNSVSSVSLRLFRR